MSRVPNLKSSILGFLLLVFFLACQEPKPDSKPPRKQSEGPLFKRLGYERTGIEFTNLLKESPELNILTFEYFANGGGVAIGDINNDELPDIYFTGNMGPNRLYLNQGNLKFKDITRESGTDGGLGWSNGVVMEDINQDGWLDIYVCRSGNFPDQIRANQLFINNGDNSFTERAEEFGLNIPSYSTHAGFLDYDRDGDLDLYLLNHNISAPENISPQQLKTKYDERAGDKFFENRNGKFIDISKQVGIYQNPIGFGLGLGISDLDQNGYPDLYVCNDYLEHDYLYMNNGDGTFSEKLKDYIKHTSNFSMGCDIADVNNDGLPDIFVLDMAPEDNYSSKTNMAGMNPERFYRAVNTGFHYQYMINTLQLNHGGNIYSEIGHYAGMAKTDWSWAPLFYDLDNDGLKDAFITNGYKMNSRNKDFEKYKLEYYRAVRDNPNSNHAPLVRKLLDQMPEIKIPNYVFKNTGDLKFKNMISAWGLQEASFSNGAALGDLDLDGDLDIVINNIAQEVFLYENLSEGSSLRIKLKGPKTNPNGIGAKVRISYDGQQQVVENYASRGYMSSNEPVVHFGIPENAGELSVEVTWSDGRRSAEIAGPDEKIMIIDYSGSDQFLKREEEINVPFHDVSTELNPPFQHEENDFDDFTNEILLPHRMSRLGPGLAVADINQDGKEDFFVGNGAGFSAAMYVQGPEGGFTQTQSQLWASEAVFEDMGAAFFDFDNDGDEDLYVVSGGTRREPGSGIYKDRIYSNDGQGNFSRQNNILPESAISGSCVKPNDFDNDGDVDLFVGGRVVPGNYPFPAQNQILVNEGGKFRIMEDGYLSSIPFSGMVTDALWHDFNNDSKIDLILAGEWMPVLAYENTGNGFSFHDTLAPNGWWFSLGLADLNGDGSKEIIAGNMGENYKYTASEEEPFHIFSGDLDANGSNDIYLGYFQGGEIFPVRGRECSSQQMPFVSEKYKTYNEFGKATIFDVLGNSVETALHYTAKEFRSGWIEMDKSGGSSFNPFPFPAQFSAVNSIVVLDLDGNGLDDLIMAGNLYGSEIETPRNDAGIGTVLLSKPGNGFQVLPHANTGFLADGDVKSMATINLGNGKKGFLVGRNSDRISLIEFSPNLLSKN